LRRNEAGGTRPRRRAAERASTQLGIGAERRGRRL
jgi:hypothetical protein